MSFQIRPIGPDDVQSRAIPEFVIEAVNELIAEKYTGSGSFTIRQKDIIERIKSKTEQDIDFKWLDFEQLYRDAGWRVDYDKPGYNESYEAYFQFSRK